MANMHKILEGIKVDHLIAELDAHPELWNQYTFRTTVCKTSPHKEVDDIILRCRDFSDYDVDNTASFLDKHNPVWYASAYHLPSIKDTIEKIFTLVDGYELGACLITRIPPGKSVKPHSDAGAWHSEYFLNKYLLLLNSAPGQSFNFGEEKHEGESGSLFIFDNRHVHEVINNSDQDRISLILSIKKRDQ